MVTSSCARCPDRGPAFFRLIQFPRLPSVSRSIEAVRPKPCGVLRDSVESASCGVAFKRTQLFAKTKPTQGSGSVARILVAIPSRLLLRPLQRGPDGGALV